MYDWAKPGVKVVCIEAVVSRLIPLIEAGEVHTISRIEMGYRVGSDGNLRRDLPQEVALWFEGLDTGNYSYMAKNFRPLVEKKLPDSLTSILTNPMKSIRKDQFDKGKVYDPI